MKRRTYLKAVAAAFAGTAAAQGAAGKPGIQLYVDLAVDMSREKEMLKTFNETFRPAAARQPGYIDVQMLRLRSAIMGTAPADTNYRFVLLFESEELRQKWIKTDTHQQVWPAMEKFLKHKNYTVLLFEYPQQPRA